MIHRNIVQIQGPPGAGKTNFAEALLRSTLLDVICMRAIRDESVKEPRETRPRTNPELRRYLAAGASGVVLYKFPEADSDAFYTSDFMMNYSDAVLIEGDNPLGLADLVVCVIRPSPEGTGLLSRAKGRRGSSQGSLPAGLEGVLQSPESLLSLLLGGFGDRAVDLARKNPEILEQVRGEIEEHLTRARRSRPSATQKRWMVNPEYRGVEQAQVVIVNVHGEAELSLGERLVEDVGRLRTDDAVFRDILGFRGSRVPITAVVADLSDPRHPGLRKALTRVKRALKRTD